MRPAGDAPVGVEIRLLAARALKEAGERVEVVRLHRVELVVVTPRAAHRHAQERLAHHVDLVRDALRLVAAHVDRAVRALAQEPEAGADDRFVVALRRVAARGLDKIAGDMLDDELVVGDVGVERANDVVAILPRVADRVVEFVAVRPA